MSVTATSAKVPTLYEWAGGREKIETLFRRFYEKVPKDAVVGPVFAKMPAHHHKIVAHFVTEVLGGPVRARVLRAHVYLFIRHLYRRHCILASLATDTTP